MEQCTGCNWEGQWPFDAPCANCERNPKCLVGDPFDCFMEPSASTTAKRLMELADELIGKVEWDFPIDLVETMYKAARLLAGPETGE